MNYFYRLIIIVFLVAALLGWVLPAEAEPLSALPHSTNTAITQVTAEALNKLGIGKMLSGDSRGAMEDFTQAIQLNPNDAKAYGNRGLARATLGEQQGAIADFTQALQLNPQLAVAYYNRGFIHLELQDYQAALVDFSQAIQLNPQHADAYQCRCLVRQKLGEDKQGTLADFHAAAALYLQQGKLEQYLSLVDSIKKRGFLEAVYLDRLPAERRLLG